MSDTCKHCDGTGKEPASKLPFRHYKTLAELKATLLEPKESVPLTCVRCGCERDMTITFGEPPANPNLDAVAQLASIVDGSRIVVSLVCSACGPYPATRVVELRPIFDLHNLWGAEVIPEALMRSISEIRANAARAKGVA